MDYKGLSQRVKVQHDITYQHQRIVTCHERLGWLGLNFVKIIPERSETRDMFKVIRSNTEIAITPVLVGFKPYLKDQLVSFIALTPLVWSYDLYKSSPK